MTTKNGPVTGVFAGGGVRGIALAGAATSALLAGYRFDRIVGTSAGALIGSLVAAGYSAGELAKGVRSIPWADLADPVPGATLPLIGRHVAIVGNKAMYRGDRLEEIWGDLLTRNGVETFGDLPPGALRVVATDITHQRGVVLPDDLAEYGIDPWGFSVARAVRMSAAVPFVFRPVSIREPGNNHTAVFVDGALAANFPLRIVHRTGDRVLGFRLVPEAGSHMYLPVRGPTSLARAVIGAAIRAADTLPTSTDDAMIVNIPAAGDPLAFDVSDEVRDALFASGREAFRRWLRAPAPAGV